MIGPSPPVGVGKKEVTGPQLPAAHETTAGAVRRATIGPSSKPSVTEDLVSLAAAAQAEKAKQLAQAERVDSSAVARCKKGELPPKGWASRWNAATKRQALIVALEAGQMHVVYALRPRSEAFQESTGAAEIDQEELNRLLKSHAAKAKAQEVVAWLLEEGASLETLCAADDSAARSVAVALVSRLDDPVARAMELLKNSDWRVRATAADVIAGRTKDASEHIDAIVQLLEDEMPVVRSSAVAALGRFGAPAASACAKKFLSDNAKAREAAAEAMGKIGPAADDTSIIALAELLEDSHWQVPSAAANALKKVGAPAAGHVANVLNKCSDLAQPVAAEALSRIGGNAAADAAAILLTSPKAGVRCQAVTVLGEVGAEAASAHMDALSRIGANDSDRDVKKAYQKAMRQLRPPSCPTLRNDDHGDALPDFGKGKGKAKGKGNKGGRSERSRSRDRHGGRGR
mmetsp:Transcript_46701/g.108870  ORF Transcript_46701/g.108870 Transcript_46701/m.108870 type:complete len:459 (-) Transcript_46701:14-1390(-)